MSQVKHTPGPWSLKHVSGSNFAVQRFEIRGVFLGHEGKAVVFNKDTSAIDGTTVCCSPGDARLIAAAPELLEALQDLLQVMEQHEQIAGCDSMYGDNARAAIAKATGGAT